MQRRDMLRTASAAMLGSLAFPLRHAAAAPRKRKVLFFTRNVGYYHAVVQRKGDQLGHAEKALVDFGGAAGIEVVCTKDGRVFDDDIDQFDAIAMYCNGDLTKPNPQNEPPMTARGKQRLLDAVAAGKGLVGFHSSCACWRTPGPGDQNSDQLDPFIAMLGGEFISHGPQQAAPLTIASDRLGDIRQLADASVTVFDEWYALKNFAPDLHVFLVQETAGMKGECYQRPPFPATWGRHHEQGRVFYTSMGHPEAVWTNPIFQTVTLAGMRWAMGDIDVRLSPNIDTVTPKARQLLN